jgi:hypothetical protein
VNRRGFFKALGAIATTFVVPQLIVPQQTIFLPPAGGWASQTLDIDVMLSQMWDRYAVYPRMLVVSSEVAKYCRRVHLR